MTQSVREVWFWAKASRAQVNVSDSQEKLVLEIRNLSIKLNVNGAIECLRSLSNLVVIEGIHGNEPG